MNFGQAVSTCFRKYVDFSGRARRSEYWWFALFYAIVYLVAAVLDAAAHTAIFVVLVFLAFVLPSLAAGVRRLHDTGRTGWWILLGLIPFVGGIALIVMFCLDGQRTANRWGPSPKYPDGQPGGYGPYGGYGPPQGGAYGPPPVGPGYGQPPAGPSYGQPSYGAPQQGGAYGQPPAGPPYGAPQQSGAYGRPPAGPSYGQPPAGPGFNPPPAPPSGRATGGENPGGSGAKPPWPPAQ